VLDLLADELGVATSGVELVAVPTSSHQQIRVSGLDRDELEVRLRRALRDADGTGRPRSRHRGE